MKYILMMNAPKKGWDELATWPKGAFQAHVDFMHKFNKELKDAGEFVAAEGLAGPDQAKIVRAGANGTPITDGVFPEAKEFLAGYWIVDVESPERVYQVAARASMAPGPAGTPLYIPIEVRQVMSGPPPELL
jgi:hypothetical protein